MKKTLVISFCMLLSEMAFCGIGSDLEKFFNQMGGSTNITDPDVHHDQSAGYYSGGGVSLRNRSKNVRLGTVQLPQLKAGCGGIDIFTGGLSHISSAQLVEALKTIGSNAVSYGFMLAMKTFAPSVQSVMAELQDIASKINQSNINSCEMAASLVGGAWPKSDLASRHICTSIGANEGNAFKDWASARHGCGAGRESRRDEYLSKKDSSEVYKDILVEEFNVAWEVLKKNSAIFEDKELSQLCMTISGTIISYKSEGKRHVRTLASRADNDNLVKALFEGGSTEIYTCSDDKKCLSVSSLPKSIVAGTGFATRVRKMLSDITAKAIRDEPLNQAEIAFIGKVRLPIYKMVNVLAAYKRKEFDLKDYTDIICVDLIHQYITEILDVMLEEVGNLKNAQVSDKEINEFVSQLHKAKSSINEKRRMAYEQMNQMLIMIEATKSYERKLEGAFDTNVFSASTRR